MKEKAIHLPAFQDASPLLGDPACHENLLYKPCQSLFLWQHLSAQKRATCWSSHADVYSVRMSRGKEGWQHISIRIRNMQVPCYRDKQTNPANLFWFVSCSPFETFSNHLLSFLDIPVTSVEVALKTGVCCILEGTSSQWPQSRPQLFHLPSSQSKTLPYRLPNSQHKIHRQHILL